MEARQIVRKSNRSAESRAPSSMQTGTSTMANGSTTVRMAMVCTSTTQGPDMKDTYSWCLE